MQSWRSSFRTRTSPAIAACMHGALPSQFLILPGRVVPCSLLEQLSSIRSRLSFSVFRAICGISARAPLWRSRESRFLQIHSKSTHRSLSANNPHILRTEPDATTNVTHTGHRSPHHTSHSSVKREFQRVHSDSQLTSTSEQATTWRPRCMWKAPRTYLVGEEGQDRLVPKGA